MPGFYERRVFPWINDLAGRLADLRALRQELLGQAYGRVLEIGFGSGANLPFYPAAVTEVVGVEPSSGMLDRARARLLTFSRPVHVMEADAERLDVSSQTVDTAVSTLTLCSVRDPRSVLRELHRVLKPGGALLVLEHGLSPDPKVASRQHRWNGVQGVLACGCHLNRPIASLIEDAGFAVHDLRSRYLAGAPRVLGWVTVGAARARHDA